MLTHLSSRKILEIKGAEAALFLHGLLTQDVVLQPSESLLYGCLLSARGRVQFDLMIYKITPDHFFLEADGDRIVMLQKSLEVYRLRRKVSIAACPDRLVLWSDTLPDQPLALCFRDPRHPLMGVRILMEVAQSSGYSMSGDAKEYHKRRLDLIVPEGACDMQPERAIPLEYNLDELGAFNWKKGCYVGQELMSRMKHRNLIRKGLVKVSFQGPLAQDDAKLSSGEFLTVDEDEVGEVVSSYGQEGFALIKLEKYQYARLKGKQICAHNLPVDIAMSEWLAESLSYNESSDALMNE